MTNRIDQPGDRDLGGLILIGGRLSPIVRAYPREITVPNLTFRSVLTIPMGA